MIRQLSVFVENRPGSFREVTEALGGAGIRIHGFCSVDSPEFGILRMITDCPEKAAAVLEEKGFMTKCYEVLAVELAGQDTLCGLLDACTGSNISINYMYSIFGGGNAQPAAVLYCEYLEETESMLKGKGFSCL